MNFYENFVSICMEKGIAPSAAVAKAGFDKSIVSYWKKHPHVSPKIDTLQKIADVLDIEIIRLIPENLMTSLSLDNDLLCIEFGGNYGHFVHDSGKKRINDAYEQLNQTGKKVAIQRIEELAKIKDYQKNNEPGDQNEK